MKKLLVAFAVLVALALGAAPANALMGMPDDMPGDCLLQPFFLASMPGMGNVNTLMVMTDVKGGWPAGPTQVLHYDVLTKKSETVYNDWLVGTEGDIISTDAASIVAKMSPSEKVKLEIDLDGDGVNDTYVGYIEFNRNISTIANNVIGQFLVVNLAAGMASSANIPTKEWNPFVPPVMIDLWDTYALNTELFSANALATAESLQVGGPPVLANAFGLFPRYYIVQDLPGQTLLFIWKSVNHLGSPSANEFHVYFFNDEEDFVSSNIPLPDELNIIDVEKYIPAALHPDPAAPDKQGWIFLVMPDLYNRPTVLWGDWEWLGYTWQAAEGTAAESWTTLTPMHRAVWW